MVPLSPMEVSKCESELGTEADPRTDDFKCSITTDQLVSRSVLQSREVRGRARIGLSDVARLEFYRNGIEAVYDVRVA